MPRRRARPGDPLRAVGYLRASTREQKLSTEAQRAAVETWAPSTGATVIAWHLDQGVSGGAPLELRPGLLAALTALREHSTCPAQTGALSPSLCGPKTRARRWCLLCVTRGVTACYVAAPKERALTIRFSADDYALLQRLAEEHDVPAAYVVRRALRAYAAPQEKEAAPKRKRSA